MLSIFCVSAIVTLQGSEVDPCQTQRRVYIENKQNWNNLISKNRNAILNYKFNKNKAREIIINQMREQTGKEFDGWVQTLSDALTSTGGTVKKLNFSKELRNQIINKKINAVLVEKKGEFDALLLKLENEFNSEKNVRLKELNDSDSEMQDNFNSGDKQLNQDCNMALTAQLQRLGLLLVKILLQTEYKIENNRLIVDKKYWTYLPSINNGKLMLGPDHLLMDLPVIKDGMIKVGNVDISMVPMIVEGGKMIQIGPIKTDIPRIDIPIHTGGDHGGLGISVGNLKF